VSLLARFKGLKGISLSLSIYDAAFHAGLD